MTPALLGAIALTCTVAAVTAALVASRWRDSRPPHPRPFGPMTALEWDELEAETARDDNEEDARSSGPSPDGHIALSPRFSSRVTPDGRAFVVGPLVPIADELQA